jgi:hypothetical protein
MAYHSHVGEYSCLLLDRASGCHGKFDLGSNEKHRLTRVISLPKPTHFVESKVHHDIEVPPPPLSDGT